MIETRFEQPADDAATDAVHRAAFPSGVEAELVAALRRAGRLTVSIVADESGRVLGHVGLSPIQVVGAADGLGLGPLAVVPAFQRRGIGSRLVRSAVEAAANQRAGFIVVLGDPAYYRRFGFVPASRFGLVDAYGGGEAFQVLELRPGAVPHGSGLVGYAPEFALVAGGASPSSRADRIPDPGPPAESPK